MERLLDDPWSRWRAKRVGGEHWREHLGWAPDTYLHALLVDAVQINTAVTAVHGTGKRPKIPAPTPRPTPRPDDEPDLEREWTADELVAAQAELNR